MGEIKDTTKAVGAIMHICMRTLKNIATVALIVVFLCGQAWASTATEIKAWRLSQGFTQAQAAAKVGVSASTWSAWETGAREPSAYNRDTLVRLGILVVATPSDLSPATASCPPSTPCTPCADRCKYHVSLAPPYKCEAFDNDQDGTADTAKCGGNPYNPCPGRSWTLLTPAQVTALPGNSAFNVDATFACN